MTPERKFELDAIGHFLDGIYKNDPEVGYCVLVKHPDEPVNFMSNIEPSEIAGLLRAAADASNTMVITDTDGVPS